MPAELTTGKPVRVALVGCGAVVQKSHIPALLSSSNYSIEVLVDKNLELAERLQGQVNVPVVTTDVLTALDHFDLAVVATPSASHFALGTKLLSETKHVLMEKPLATSSQQASNLITLANEKNCLLAVSLVRRYLPHFKLFKQLLNANVIGKLKSFSIAEGSVFNWPVQSAEFYSPSASGGGVLIDHGAHLLDACLWWFGEYSDVQYSDDSCGGVEADCELQLSLKNGAVGQVTMSRLRSLSGLVIAHGDKASIEMNLASGEISLLPNGGHQMSLVGKVDAPSVTGQISTVDLFKDQYQQIHKYLLDPNSAANLVTGVDCLGSIGLIEQCYSVRSSDEYKVWS